MLMPVLVLPTLTDEQINYWSQRYRLYYNALTEEEQRMVNAYIELSMQE